MRYWFGGSPADYVVSPGDQVPLTDEMIGYQTVLVPGVRLWVYDPDTGDRVTDLLDSVGNQVDHILTAEYGAIPRFRGPDEARRLLIGPEPTGPTDPGEDDGGQEAQGRWIITTPDWPLIVGGLDSRVTVLEQGGGGDPEDPELVATAHPLVWTYPGPVNEDRTSPHPYWNLEGKNQTITTVRAQATVTTGELTVVVLRIDPDTQDTTQIGAVLLDTTTTHAIITPGFTLSEGSGLTVGVERGSEADDIADVTVQVMAR